MAGRILIIDDTATTRIILKARLASAAYPTVQADTAQDALRRIRDGDISLVLIGGSLATMDACALCRRIRALPGADTVPLVRIGGPADRASRLRALAAGFDAALDHVPGSGMLLAWIRNLMRRHAGESELKRSAAAPGATGFAAPDQAAFLPPGRIALIAPTPVEGLRWRNALKPLLRDRIEVLHPDRALADLTAGAPPDAIVLAETRASGNSAMRLLAELRSRPETLRSSIVMLSDTGDASDRVMALDFGVSDLVETGFDAEDLALRLRRELARKARSDSYRAAMQDNMRMAALDPLTGLYNRRFALAELEHISAEAQVCGKGFAVMMLDLDRFKRINDTRGHAAGDTVLREVARRLPRCLRRGDLLARIGGEEFLAVIRNCDTRAACRAAERLRRIVSDRPVAMPDGGAPIPVTMSIGLFTSDPRDAGELSPAQMLDLADRALYSAKADGRNQVTMHRTAA